MSPPSAAIRSTAAPMADGVRTTRESDRFGARPKAALEHALGLDEARRGRSLWSNVRNQPRHRLVIPINAAAPRSEPVKSYGSRISIASSALFPIALLRPHVDDNAHPSTGIKGQNRRKKRWPPIEKRWPLTGGLPCDGPAFTGRRARRRCRRRT
jgi:hypothetical protein